jgi:glucose-1-phosphate cytidylyltransferase
MKAVILAGGLGTRLSEETDLKPKPMVEIGGMPILWHIMKIYSAHGVNDFVICLGYKGYKVKEFFSNYFMHTSDITFSLKDNRMKVHHTSAENWEVTLVDTGEGTQTGGRLKRVQKHLEGDSDFCFTYGDGVGDIDIQGLIAYHKNHGKLATVTATVPAGRYGALALAEDNSTVESFREKPVGNESWVNGGFFVLRSEVLNLIDGDATSWEAGPLASIAQQGQLKAFKHAGFWQPMDTLREKTLLNQLWDNKEAPWKTWK